MAYSGNVNPFFDYQRATYDNQYRPPMQPQQNMMQMPAYQPQPQQIQPMQAPQDDRTWVPSRAAAEAYPMQPNSFMRFWDSTQPFYYDRQTDAQGKPYPTLTYKYELWMPEAAEKTAPAPAAVPDYESRIEEIKKKMEEMSNELAKLKEQVGGTGNG